MEPTDIELMLRVRAGEVAAFRELTTRYREPLRRFFSAMLADRSLADDFVQETLLRLWLTRERYEPTGRFSTYLFQIGKHYWLNQRKQFRPDLGEEALDGIPARGTEEPEVALIDRLRDARIHRAIARLPERYRRVFEMSHFDGMRYAEIARRLGIPEGTVKSRMAESVRRLRLALGDDQGEDP